MTDLINEVANIIRVWTDDASGWSMAMAAEVDALYVAEIERLRAGTAVAVQELKSEHRRFQGFCCTCSGSWPCVASKIADDLAKLLEREEE